MNRYYTAIYILLSSWSCCSCIAVDYPEVERARLRGAQGRVTLRITDSADMPVEDAKTSVAFWASDSLPDVISRDGTTDTNGYYVATGITRDRMGYLIEKDGYYSTHGELSFYRHGEDCVENGRWQPWNPTNTIVLKERRIPATMFAQKVEVIIPVMDKAIGFDLEQADWVAPYGEGRNADLLFTYNAEYEGTQEYSKRLSLSFSNSKDGLRTYPLNKSSELMSLYEAPANGYESSLLLERARTRTEVALSEEFGADKYLIFRTRTVTDDEGNIISANYGKIYGPIQYGLIDHEYRLRFDYYFNPTPNDRNIEFDRKHNLIAKPGRGTIYLP
jgi:hypothetical protein